MHYAYYGSSESVTYCSSFGQIIKDLKIGYTSEIRRCGDLNATIK